MLFFTRIFAFKVLAVVRFSMSLFPRWLDDAITCGETRKSEAMGQRSTFVLRTRLSDVLFGVSNGPSTFAYDEYRRRILPDKLRYACVSNAYRRSGSLRNYFIKHGDT